MHRRKYTAAMILALLATMMANTDIASADPPVGTPYKKCGPWQEKRVDATFVKARPCLYRYGTGIAESGTEVQHNAGQFVKIRIHSLTTKTREVTNNTDGTKTQGAWRNIAFTTANAATDRNVVNQLDGNGNVTNANVQNIHENRTFDPRNIPADLRFGNNDEYAFNYTYSVGAGRVSTPSGSGYDLVGRLSGNGFVMVTGSVNEANWKTTFSNQPLTARDQHVPWNEMQRASDPTANCQGVSCYDGPNRRKRETQGPGRNLNRNRNIVRSGQ